MGEGGCYTLQPNWDLRATWFCAPAFESKCEVPPAALLLSFGCGLVGAELGSARGSDLIATPWGLFIETEGLSSKGNRGHRNVPILAEYEDELSELALEAGDNLLLGTGRDGGLRKPHQLFPRRSALPGYKTSRARANWTRALLVNEVSFIAMRIAGVTISIEGNLLEWSVGLEPSFERYVRTMRAGLAPFDQSKHQHLRLYAVGQ